MNEKEALVDQVKGPVRELLDNLHPADRVDAYRELGKWCESQAGIQEQVNECVGVPEREPKPLAEKIARSGI